MHITDSKRTRRLGSVLLVLLGLAIGWVLGQIDRPREAQAGLPNPVEQRMDQIQELRKVCAKLDEIKAVLKSGDVIVRVQAAEKSPGGAANR